MSFIAVALLLPVLVGCLGSEPSEPHPEAVPSEPSPAQLHAHGPLTDGAFGREPALAATDEGTLFVAAWAGDENEQGSLSPLVWRSTDRGETFERLSMGSGAPDDALANSDVDLAVGPDGVLYLAQMFFVAVPAVVFPGAAAAITVGTSQDGGDTWRWTTPVSGPGVDRPWIEVSPDGTAHLVWNDVEGVHHATSTDGGATWTEGPLAHPEGGDGALVASGDLLAVRIVPPYSHGYGWASPEVDGVTVSLDGGETWTFHQLPGERDWRSSYADLLIERGFTRFWDPLALGPNGTLYAGWTEGDAVVLARSSDEGESWMTEELVSARPGAMFPRITTGGTPGQLAVTWFERDDGATSAHLARATWHNGTLEASIWTLANETGGTWGEYFPVDIRQGGEAWTAVPVDEGGGPLLRLAEIHPLSNAAATPEP